jgi:hypothetical protein
LYVGDLKSLKILKRSWREGRKEDELQYLAKCKTFCCKSRWI